MSLPTTAARTAALGEHERKPCTVLELVVDRCANVYGTAPCTAAGAVGSECYNTYATCQAKATYVKTTQTMKFCSRGVLSPLGETLRPYLLGTVNAPVNLDFEAGLASRSNVSINLANETDNDSDQDPYWATRATPAAGTYWARWLARNKNYFGRTAKLRKGFVASPWDWDLFLDELYIIDNIAIETSGQIKLTLKDPLKLADMTTIPLPTSGVIQADTKAIEHTNNVVAATGTTITFAITGDSVASALDDYYNGMEVYIYANTGAGQRRVIADYVGATRVATVAAWSVTPDTTSAYEVSALQVTLDAGKGAQYADPATSGKAEYIRINSEIIRYTALTGDVLSWPDATYRAQFGTTRGDHSAEDSAQLCRAFIDQTIEDVLTDLLTESGVDAGYISASLGSETLVWYGSTFNITACLSAPEKSSSLLAEILKQIGAVMWWSPHTQKVEFKAIMPSVSAYPVYTDEANIIQGSLSVKNLDNLRITQAAISYAQRDATSSLSESRSFQRTDVVVNLNAQSVNEYGDKRPKVVTSRWFKSINATAMVATATRQINRLYNAPKLFTLKIDPKDYTIPLGSLVGIQSFKNVDVDGQPKTELCIITQMNDAGGHIDLQARSANFASRYGYIAPNGTADYPTEQVYAHICQNTGLMTNGDEPFRII
ncbi:MAG: hypothetical protein B7Y56_03390 [Gallionellales bacterium 35-53-114]|jgi:hypothetical protein|nr:MAG: hypothetical protein B7Y56_03390 [Gallionellales bacterium 35-53-114]OYZ65149.1 MAG: hypothetical protein B7Y04_00550 [Gallionellales bacterium 24-53-125]OZB08057.1 MAG: hypothetical protein B7X61_11000 [Gallionellales bacterium 39-52-133]HQS59961.1 hypothetical protein [Gallionellaceae bacterium]HQS76657.1 hypothetical protein [Gallionellaceae bacterium]